MIMKLFCFIANRNKTLIHLFIHDCTWAYIILPRCIRKHFKGANFKTEFLALPGPHNSVYYAELYNMKYYV